MKLTRLVLAASLAAAAGPALAAFTPLPTQGTLRVYGSNSPFTDPLLLQPGVQTNNELPFTFELPSNLVLLAAIRETDFALPSEDEPGELEEVGEFFDAVFRDSNDGKLVFGSRIVLDPSEEGEINDIFRFGFSNFDVEVAWTFVSSDDLNLFSAARSLNSNIEDDSDDEFDADAVGLATDVNVDEDKPQTGWYLIKTNATGFRLTPNAIGLNQAGEEDQPPYIANLTGYSPVPVPAAVWLLGSAVVGVAGFKRARR